MRNIFIAIIGLTFAACSNSAPTVVTNSNTNTNASADRPLRSGQMNTIAHTTENQPPKAANSNTGGGKWTASGEPIDTARFDGVIAEAEKAVKAKPNDEAAKKTLAQAYFDRGAALTEARQYASAIGDYRRALKHDPTHEESKKWIDQIVGIYAMLKKEAPKEGEEPPPLPFKKD